MKMYDPTLLQLFYSYIVLFVQGGWGGGGEALPNNIISLAI